jgi:hypothetical protein
MGPAKNAAKFFIESSTLQFNLLEYNNPADFLYDISACRVQNKNVINCILINVIISLVVITNIVI